MTSTNFDHHQICQTPHYNYMKLKLIITPLVWRVWQQLVILYETFIVYICISKYHEVLRSVCFSLFFIESISCVYETNFLYRWHLIVNMSSIYQSIENIHLLIMLYLIFIVVITVMSIGVKKSFSKTDNTSLAESLFSNFDYLNKR